MAIMKHYESSHKYSFEHNDIHNVIKKKLSTTMSKKGALLRNFLGISSDKGWDAIGSMPADSSRLTEKR